MTDTDQHPHAAARFSRLFASPVLASTDGYSRSSTSADGVFHRDKITFAAFVSACSRWPHAVQTKFAWLSRLCLSMWPHAEQVRELLWAGTLKSAPPRSSSL